MGTLQAFTEGIIACDFKKTTGCRSKEVPVKQRLFQSKKFQFYITHLNAERGPSPDLADRLIDTGRARLVGHNLAIRDSGQRRTAAARRAENRQDHRAVVLLLAQDDCPSAAQSRGDEGGWVGGMISLSRLARYTWIFFEALM